MALDLATVGRAKVISSTVNPIDRLTMTATRILIALFAE
jgi:hypothetical protein